jgi:ABC-2 type transport system permease protein
LLAALIVASLACVTLGGLTAVGLIAAGLSPAGSLSFGAAWALTGLAFSVVAGVVAQLTQSGRAARGLALIGVGVAYVLRAVGDLAANGPGWASWLSPIGWSQQLRRAGSPNLT